MAHDRRKAPGRDPLAMDSCLRFGDAALTSEWEVTGS